VGGEGKGTSIRNGLVKSGPKRIKNSIWVKRVELANLLGAVGGKDTPLSDYRNGGRKFSGAGGVLLCGLCGVGVKSF